MSNAVAIITLLEITRKRKSSPLKLCALEFAREQLDNIPETKGFKHDKLDKEIEQVKAEIVSK